MFHSGRSGSPRGINMDSTFATPYDSRVLSKSIRYVCLPGQLELTVPFPTRLDKRRVHIGRPRTHGLYMILNLKLNKNKTKLINVYRPFMKERFMPLKVIQLITISEKNSPD